jgi:transposase
LVHQRTFTECPRCGARKSWVLRDGRRRCARCRFDWKPGRLPLRLSRAEWRVLIAWFVREAPSAEIAYETGLERKRVLRALTILRGAIWRSSRRGRDGRSETEGFPRQRTVASPRRSAIIGIYAVHGDVGAEILSARELERLVSTFGERRHDAPGGAPSLERYVAVVVRGRLHRLSRAGEGRAPFGQIEGFWAYVQRHLRTKGGIRPGRLDLYLAEFAWRYNRRRLSPPEQAQELMRLVRRYARWTERDSPPELRSRDGPGFFPIAMTGKP